MTARRTQILRRTQESERPKQNAAATETAFAYDAILSRDLHELHVNGAASLACGAKLGIVISGLA
jgi:hypothetical protein